MDLLKVLINFSSFIYQQLVILKIFMLIQRFDERTKGNRQTF